MLERSARQRGEDRHRGEDAELVGVRRGRRGVDPGDRRTEQDDEDGRKAPAAMSAVFDAEPRDEHGHERGADADRSEPEHLDDAEDTRENVVRDSALNERQPGDVDERAADPQSTEHDDCDGDVRPDADRDQRKPDERRCPTRNAGLRRVAPVSESAPTRPDERSDADGGVQVADAAVSEVEQLERRRRR